MARRAANVSRASSLDCRIVFFFFPHQSLRMEKKTKAVKFKGSNSMSSDSEGPFGAVQVVKRLSKQSFPEAARVGGRVSGGKNTGRAANSQNTITQTTAELHTWLNAVMSIRKLAFLTEPQDGADLQNAEHCAVTPALFNSPLQYVLRAW